MFIFRFHYGSDRITTQLLIVSYVGAFFVLIFVPLLMARYLNNIEWPLPLKIKIIGIDTESYPGYAIHYMFCFCSIFNGALVIGGKYFGYKFENIFI